MDRIKLFFTAFFVLVACSVSAQSYMDTTVGKGGDLLPILKPFIGTLAELRANTNSTYVLAITTGAGGGYWRKNNTIMQADNGGSIVWSANGDKWQRQYDGDDRVSWYAVDGGTDSAIIQRAYNNARSGLTIDAGVYDSLNLLLFNRDNINVRGEGISNTRLIQTGIPTTLSSLIWFKDASDLKINNVKISNLTLDGNGALQTGTNASVIRQGSGSLDTVKNITLEDLRIVNGQAGRSAVYLITDSLRNGGWLLRRVEIDSSYGGAMELRGVTNMLVENSLFKAWSLANPDSAACINTQNPIVRGVEFINTVFRNTVATRFLVEASGLYVDFLFQNIDTYGNGKDVNGFSGKGWYNGVWDNVRMYDGAGGHRSGFELVGGNLKILNTTCYNGALTIDGVSYAGQVSAGLPAKYLKFNNKNFVIDNLTMVNDIGGNITINGDDSLSGFSLSNSHLTASNSFPNLEIKTGRDITVSNTYLKSGAWYNVRFSNGVWSPSDTVNGNISFNLVTFKSSFVSPTSPNIQFQTQSVLSKWKNVKFTNNEYSQSVLWNTAGTTTSADSLAASWTVVNNKSSGETTNGFYFQGRIIKQVGNGNPNGVISAVRGSEFTDTTNNKSYRKDTNTGNTGWTEIGGGGGGSSKIPVKDF